MGVEIVRSDLSATLNDVDFAEIEQAFNCFKELP